MAAKAAALAHQQAYTSMNKGIKIKLVEIDGEMRVPPEVMDLLMRFAGHRDFCDQCKAAFESGTAAYCHIGMEIMRTLADQPEVEPMGPK